jgi:transcriptional regulator with XRE-family HTH domain
MSLSSLEAPPRVADGFAALLRDWRRKRRVSQLDLALSSGASQRHVSFLESGRARPSRSMILRLSETLDVPLRERNAWLTAAGFAPMFKTRALDDPTMRQVMGAVRMMLTNHEPFPAIALDRAWNIRMTNAPFDRLNAGLGADLWDRLGGGEPNLMRLFYHPAGIRPLITNWSAVGALVWRRAEREAESLGGQDMKAILAELAPYQDPETLKGASEAALVPVLPFDLALGDLRLSMFAVVATFGTAQDVTTDELRIETLFPADPATEAFFRAGA